MQRATRRLQCFFLFSVTIFRLYLSTFGAGSVFTVVRLCVMVAEQLHVKAIYLRNTRKFGESVSYTCKSGKINLIFT